MSGSIRRWVVLGALASGSLLFAACEDRPGEGVEVPGGPDETPVGGRFEEEPLEVEPGSELEEGEATGGGGYEVPQELGTPGQGVTGGDFIEEGATPDTGTWTERGGIRGPTIPEPDEREPEVEREVPKQER